VARDDLTSLQEEFPCPYAWFERTRGPRGGLCGLILCGAAFGVERGREALHRTKENLYDTLPGNVRYILRYVGMGPNPEIEIQYGLEYDDKTKTWAGTEATLEVTTRLIEESKPKGGKTRVPLGPPYPRQETSFCYHPPKKYWASMSPPLGCR